MWHFWSVSCARRVTPTLQKISPTKIHIFTVTSYLEDTETINSEDYMWGSDNLSQYHIYGNTIFDLENLSQIQKSLPSLDFVLLFKFVLLIYLLSDQCF